MIVLPWRNDQKEETERGVRISRWLKEQGLTSGVSYEKDRRSYEEAEAKLKAANQYVEAAEKYLSSKQAELGQKTLEAQTKVDYGRAMQQEAQGEVALARKELAEIEGKQAQFDSRVVVAPRDGVILRLLSQPGSEFLKAGQPLVILVPESTSLPGSTGSLGR